MSGHVSLAGSYYKVTCPPHVMTRLKRVFAKVDRKQFGSVLVFASDENSRDLEWFLERYPMEVDERAELTARAREHDRKVRETVDILNGKFALPARELALPPREYQSQAAALCRASGALLLADELGLGKTVSAITLMSHEGTLPAVVVCQAHLTEQWAREIRRFMPDALPMVAKTTEPHSLTDRGRNADVLIVTYSKLHGWAETIAGRFPTVVFDECQELRRGGTRKGRAAQHVSANASYRLGLSATPIYNYGSEFWSVLESIKPGALGPYSEFMNEWCSHGYQADKATVSDPKAFGTYLRENGFMLRRTRGDVGRELPALTRIVHEVEADGARLCVAEDRTMELARLIVSEAASQQKFMAASEFSTVMRQETGIAKAASVAQFVRLLLDDDPEPIVLFGWHKLVYQMWAQMLEDHNPAFYTGAQSPKQKRDSIEAFVRGDSKVLVMSLRSGSGVDGLQAVTSRCVIGELDWSPGALEQCVGRVHRDGQAKPVFAYFLCATDGCDPVMVDVLDLKTEQLVGVNDPDGDAVIQKQVDPGHIRRLAEDYIRRRSK